MFAAGRLTWCLRLWWSSGPVGKRLLLTDHRGARGPVTCVGCLERHVAEMDARAINYAAVQLIRSPD